MGDRAVIGFRKTKEDPNPIFLYSHWGGYKRNEDVLNAIREAEPRWSDTSYATRIAISQIVGEGWTSEIGFGLSAGHNSYCTPDYNEIIIVTWDDRTVDIASADDSRETIHQISFSNFAEYCMV
jgi:hypothetical protein